LVLLLLCAALVNLFHTRRTIRAPAQANPPGSHCVAGCIHIFNKQAVAHRLAAAARSLVYGEKDVVYSGPRVESVSVAGTGSDGGAGAAGAFTLTVKYGAIGTEGKGIVLRSAYGFEATAQVDPSGSPAKGVWVRGNATAATKDTVTVVFPAALASAAQVGA